MDHDVHCDFLSRYHCTVTPVNSNGSALINSMSDSGEKILHSSTRVIKSSTLAFDEPLNF